MNRARPLFGRRGEAELEPLLRDASRRLLLVFDVDGTLAPIVARPGRARVPARTLRLLRRTAGARNVSAAVLSARTPAELAALVPVPGVRRVAQYGIGAVVSVTAARRRAWRRGAEEIAVRLEAVARVHAGARVERKGITVAFHDRGVPARTLDAIHRALRPVAARARSLGFAPVPGSRVLEFVPRGLGKKEALRALLRRRGAAKGGAVFYWGDSEADEPAFGVLGRGGYSVKVGQGPTRATYRVGGPEDVATFLAAVVRFRDRPGPRQGR